MDRWVKDPKMFTKALNEKKGGSRRVRDPAAPALTVSVAPATPTAVRTWVAPASTSGCCPGQRAFRRAPGTAPALPTLRG
jgi:hypothetical protein